MVISKTPFRISFFGGGTDFPSWYLKEGGAVLSTAIDKYCYLSARYLPPVFGHRYRIVWSQIETVDNLSEIVHPIAREGLRYLGFEHGPGVELHHQSDLPARSGVGSSSAFAVGLIKALYALKGKFIEKEELARAAIYLEQTLLGESVGSQDQVASAHGGFNIIEFRPGGEIHVRPLRLSESRRQELEAHLVLIYTGEGRNGTELTAHAIANIPKRTETLRGLHRLVGSAADLLSSEKDILELGTLFRETWALKRELNPLASNSRIDGLYRQAIDAGALGGKVLGAGGAGFLLLFVPPARQSRVLATLAGQPHVPFHFESAGSSLILGQDQFPPRVNDSAHEVRPWLM